MAARCIRLAIGYSVVAAALALTACSNNNESNPSGLGPLSLQTTLLTWDVAEGEIVTLRPKILAGQVETGLWEQVAGPIATQLSSSQTQLQIRAPDTRKPATLRFLYRASGVLGAEAEQRYDVVVRPRTQDRVLLGPVSAANISARLLTNPTVEIANGISASDADAGYFSLDLAELAPETWLLLVAQGGQDTDADDDGRTDAVASQNLGQIHALVQVADLNTGIRIGPLSDVVWQLVRSQLDGFPVEDLRTLLNRMAAEFFDATESASYSDLLQYSPYNPVLRSALRALDSAELAQVARDILQGKNEQQRQQQLLQQLSPRLLLPPRIILDDVFYARRGRQHQLHAQVFQFAGTLQAVQWTQLSGPSLALQDASTSSPLLDVPDEFTETSLAYQISARNAQGETSSAQVQVVITTQNLLPLVDLGPDLIVDEQQEVQLSAQLDDLDGEVISLNWRQLSGPNIALAPEQSEQTILAPITTEAVEVRLRLQLVDNEGGTAHDDIVLLVRPLNQLPSIQLQSNQNAVEGTRVMVFPQIDDIDGSIASYNWTQTAGPALELLQADLESLQFIAPATDSQLELAFSLTVTDNEGGSSSASIDILVRDQLDNEAPVIQMPARVDAPVGMAFLQGLHATDPDGDEIEFSVENAPDWLVLDRFGRLKGQAPWVMLGQDLPLIVSASDGELSSQQPLTLSFVNSSDDESVLFRFLQQATFGPRPQDVAEVRQFGLANWLDQQWSFALPAANPNDEFISQLQRTEEIAKALYPNAAWVVSGLFAANSNSFGDEIQMSAWIEQALQGKDQLRLRVAYALSQIVVVSTGEPPLESRSEGLAAYFDILIRHAFGNYRDLLGEVARSPAMGIYLSHQGNKKFNEANNTHPDENFARELMQLFAIGLYELNLDGTGRRDSEGQLIASYQQQDIEEAARVMTGWDLRGNERYGANSSEQGVFSVPMEFTAEHHDFGQKTLLGQLIPAGLTGDEDLDAALDILFQHANMAPFVAHLMIQRMVTSNPSPEYVRRVALAFEDNGLGERGDMRAVVRALLLDEEARDAKSAAAFSYGKLNEPFLAFTAFLRAFEVRALDGWRINSNEELSEPAQGIYWFRGQSALGQGPLRSRSVFNFYAPDFVPQNSYFADRNLVAPELQIRTPGNLTATHGLFQNVYEYNGILADYASLLAFAERERSWQWDSFVGVVDFSSLLLAFEQGMEGDGNGDYAQIKNDDRNAQGWTPKQRGIFAVVDQLSRRLTGRVADPTVQQVFAEELLSYSHNKNTPAAQEALNTVQAAALYFATSARHMVQK